MNPMAMRDWFTSKSETHSEDALAEFESNPELRTPIILGLDTSSSMRGKKLELLKQGLVDFKNTLFQDAFALPRIEVGLVTFGKVESHPFVSAKDFVVPELHAGGTTPGGEAVLTAGDMLRKR